MSVAENPICDFCSSPNPAWDYDADPIPDYEGDPGWLACQTCYELIEADKRQALEDRAVSYLPASQQRFFLDGFRRKVHRLHAYFFEAKKAPKPFEEKSRD